MLQVLLTENYILVNETVMKGFGLLISSSLILRKRVYTSASKKFSEECPNSSLKEGQIAVLTQLAPYCIKLVIKHTRTLQYTNLTG